MKFIVLMILGFSALSWGSNLHLIEQDKDNGFAIYRYGDPNAKDIAEMKSLGISEVMVLSGNAFDKENEGGVGGLKVFYNEEQDPNIPVTEDFLKTFDKWVEDAKDTGKKIAFRCECGCHRTGRLAAYYQMKYQNLTYEDATIIMNAHGHWMLFHRNLWPQVKAMEDYINGKPCSVEQKYCVTKHVPLTATGLKYKVTNKTTLL